VEPNKEHTHNPLDTPKDTKPCKGPTKSTFFKHTGSSKTKIKKSLQNTHPGEKNR
jgi:hypothetical protein